MGKIKLLDNNTIEKIAAGEIIERPSSIVKELLENALDAGSENIAIEIKNGGKTYIRITDDGVGIEEDDLDLAFKRHSTSKIGSLDDLYKIRSLGFRGEALASISTVAKMEVMTKTRKAIAGIHAIVEEGKIISKETIGSPKGTTMIVKDLFYNLPVRERFLKSDLIEGNQITDIIYKTILGSLESSIKFIKDNKIVLKTSRNNNMKDHIYSILGKDFSENLISIKGETKDFKIKGYFSNNKLYRSNRSHQYIYVNNRYINNKSITNIIEKKYRSIIPLNRFPVFILFIDIDPGIIDINIHPTKQEINFVNQIELIEKIDDLLEAYLYDAISIPKIKFKNKEKTSKEDSLPLLYEKKINPENDLENDIMIKDFTNTNDLMYNDIRENDSSYTSSHDYKFSINKDNLSNDKKLAKEKYICEEADKEKNNTNDILSNLDPIGVVFDTYILGEDKLNQKIYFIDQHAAHERIMYEKYLQEFNEESIVSQQLLAPEIINFTSIEMDKFLTNKEIFIKLGFDVSEFGTNSVAIRSVPLVFGEPNVKSLFYDLLDNLDIDTNINSNYETKVNKIMKMACTNAIKAGDKMSEIEILSLFHQLKETENPNSCPHGRPTILEMSKKDIEKAFLRIV